jgi:hypothetical protein
MSELSTYQAYKEFITTGKLALVAQQIGLDPKSCKVHRNQVKNDKFPSLDLMEKRLRAAGYTVIQEKLWMK